MTKVLVLSNSGDGIHTDIVIEKLQKRSAEVVRLDVDKFATGKTSVEFSLSGKSDFLLSIDGASYKSNFFDSIWYRRPNFFEPSVADPIQREHSRKEIESFIEGLWLSFDSSFWLSHPLNLEKARRKIFQLKLARELGFNIPSTLVTNNPSAMTSFYAEQYQKLIYKTMGGEFLDYGDRFFNIPTTLVTPLHLEHSHLLIQTPGMFQEQMDKEYELRVTVVGEKIFAVKIFSQAHELSMIDWRHPEVILELEYQETKLPNAIEMKCLQMMRSLGISFGAFDFCVDSSGIYTFFEINSNPQWYWLEELAGVLISDAIADILLAGPGTTTR